LLAYDGHQRASLASEDDPARPTVLALGSFSKILAPGLRLGWAHGHPSLIKALRAHGSVISGGGLNPLAAAAVHSLLRERPVGSGRCPLDAYVQNLRQVLGSRLQVMLAQLNKGLPRGARVFMAPRGGYFLWVVMPPYVSAEELFKQAQQQVGGHIRVLFQPGNRCSATGIPKAVPVSASCLRLSFAFYDQDEITAGLRTLCSLIRAAVDTQSPKQISRL
jgi:DNA-binding transcriptional MocR family regulator